MDSHGPGIVLSVAHHFLTDLQGHLIKLLEENIGEKIVNSSLGNNFLTMTSKAHQQKQKLTRETK